MKYLLDNIICIYVISKLPVDIALTFGLKTGLPDNEANEII